MPAAPDYSPRYLAALYSSAQQRALLEALLGIEREVAESLRPGLDHQVAHSRLQWWREECERTAKGQPVHPLTREVLTLLQSNANPRQGAENASLLSGLTGFVDTVTWDLAGATFETRAELTAYCERWATAMIDPLVAQASNAISGPDSSQSNTGEPDWRALGASLRELEMLTELAREAHAGRLRIPLDELDAAGVDPASLAAPPWPQALTRLLRDRMNILRAQIAAGLIIPTRGQQIALRGLLVWFALISRMALRVQRVLPESFQPGAVDSLTDTWFGWRAARRATTGRFSMAPGTLET